MRISCITRLVLAAAFVLAAAPPAPAQFDTLHNHLQCYRIRGAKVKRTVVVEDQFGTAETVVVKPALLCVPARKTPADPDPVEPTAVHPFTCYKVKPRSRHDVQSVSVTDQFGTGTVRISRRAGLLCAPAAVSAAVGGRCTDNAQCPPTSYCMRGGCVGPGNCTARPFACLDIYDPVCGCDGRTHGNACAAAAAGVNIAHDGECL